MTTHHQVMAVRVALLLTAFLLGSCSPAPRKVEKTHPPTAAECAAMGAFLDHRGMFGTAMCVTPYFDAGKICSDKADCAGRCLLDYDALAGRIVGMAATGQCQADDAHFGCYAEIADGKIIQPICDD